MVCVGHRYTGRGKSTPPPPPPSRGGGGGGGGGGSANRPPSIDGPKSLQYPEHSTEPVATYTATDPEETEISWGVEDSDEEHFRISEDGVLTFIKPPDYEDPVDFRLNNTYEIRILAFDSGIPRASGRLQVRIEIKDVNEIGPITGETALSVAENTSGSLATYQAEDPEEDAVSWSLSGSDATLFQIDESGTLSLNDALDFEAPASAAGANDYSLNVVATDDNRRPVSLELPVTVSVTNVNEGPISIQEIPLVESTAGDAVAILDLDKFFTDPDGDSLTYVIDFDEESDVASAAVEEGILSITPNEEATVSFEVTAADPSGLSITFIVNITVVSPPPPEPTPDTNTNTDCYSHAGAYVHTYSRTDARVHAGPTHAHTHAGHLPQHLRQRQRLDTHASIHSRVYAGPDIHTRAIAIANTLALTRGDFSSPTHINLHTCVQPYTGRYNSC